MMNEKDEVISAIYRILQKYTLFIRYVDSKAVYLKNVNHFTDTPL